MQYLVSVIDDGTGLATPAEEAAIDVFNDRLRAEGSENPFIAPFYCFNRWPTWSV